MAASLSLDLGGDVPTEARAETCETSVAPGTDEHGQDGLQWTTTCGPDNTIISSEFLLQHGDLTDVTDSGAVADSSRMESTQVFTSQEGTDRKAIVVVRDFIADQKQDAMKPGIEGSDIGSGA